MMQLVPTSAHQLHASTRTSVSCRITRTIRLHSHSRSLVTPQRVARKRTTVVVAHAPHGSAASVKAGPKGFVDEMRAVAMKLHTKDQAPKEGGKEASKTPMSAWQPTTTSYLHFLLESKVVYDALEEIVEQNDEYAAFRHTGLERSQALAQDVAWFEQEFGLKLQLTPGGPGSEYAALLKELAVSDPPAFICHYYNFYFAHTAGGRMIGNKVAGMILNNKELAFYQWEGDVKAKLDAVREKINKLAEGWDRQQKDHCLEETESSFKYSGKLLRLIFATS